MSSKTGGSKKKQRAHKVSSGQKKAISARRAIKKLTKKLQKLLGNSTKEILSSKLANKLERMKKEISRQQKILEKI